MPGQSGKVIVSSIQSSIVSSIHRVLLYSLVSNGHVESELLTDYYSVSHSCLDQLMGARHKHTHILSR